MRVYMRLKIDRQVDVAVEEPFCSQNGDIPAKPLGHYEGEPRYYKMG